MSKKKSTSKKGGMTVTRESNSVTAWFVFLIAIVLSSIGLQLYELSKASAGDCPTKEGISTLDGTINTYPIPPPTGVTDKYAQLVMHNFNKFTDYVYIKQSDVLID